MTARAAISADAIWIEVAATRGSAPRDAGTAMRVTAAETEGTIGGGALEWRAIAIARDMIARGAGPATRTFPLGPDLGQCCGGAVTLHFGRAPGRLDPAATRPVCPPVAAPFVDLWIWGAGHVGRALVAAAPEDLRITWIDRALDRFPPGTSRTCVPAADMPRLAAHAPRDARHLIVTYSHEIDFALCAALLARGAAHIGLIGSDTKKARFFRRLRALGLDPSRIACPIGDKALGKAPADIARGTLALLMADAARGGPA